MSRERYYTCWRVDRPITSRKRIRAGCHQDAAEKYGDWLRDRDGDVEIVVSRAGVETRHVVSHVEYWVVSDA